MVARDYFDISHEYNIYAYYGGLYKSTTHSGPGERTYLTIENSYGWAK